MTSPYITEAAAQTRTEAEARAALRKPVTVTSPGFADAAAVEAFRREWIAKGATGFTHQTVNGERVVRITFADGYDADSGKFYDMGDGLL